MKKLSNLEARRKQIERALPQVKQMVKKHGLSIVNAAILRLKEHRKKLSELEKMKSEVEKLESEI